ncbi:MAG: hypothetical protein RIB32_02735 [Phycisphaerales bacterium]
MNVARPEFLTATLVWICIATTAHAADGRDLIESGNSAFAAGSYSDALERFQAASESDERLRDVARYNEACALLALGRTDDARALFRDVEASNDAELAAAASYNLGVLSHRRATGDENATFDERLRGLEAASERFRRALDGGESSEDAARNLELTRRTMGEIRRLQKMEQQLRQMMEEMQQLADAQDAQARDSEARASQDAPEMTERDEQASEAQKTLSEQAESVRQRMQEMIEQANASEESGLPQTATSLDEARQAQEEAQQALDGADREAAAGAQERAAERLREAAESLARRMGEGESEQNSSEDPTSADQSSEGQPQEESQTDPGEDESEQPAQEGMSNGEQEGAGMDDLPEEIRAFLESILQREEADRERRRRQMGGERESKPVEKDW